VSDNIWVSYRHPDGRTFTIGGGNADVFFENLVGVFGEQEKAQRIFEDFQILADPPSPQQSQPAARSGAPAQAPPPGGPSCPHGPRTFKEAFMSKAGKQMPSSWQCQSRDRNDQCKAQWNDS
jgi:hypothetical protein